MEKRIVKIGVIGLGGRIDGFLKWGFVEVCEDFEVIAVTDIDQEQVKEKIKESPRVYRRDARIYADADEMLEKVCSLEQDRIFTLRWLLK